MSKRLAYLRIAVTTAFACGILVSFSLWFGKWRTFPRVPIVNGLPLFLSSNDYLLSLLLVVALVLSVASKRRRYLIAVVILTGLLVVLDLTRLQPWVYQYVLMMAILACKERDASHELHADPVLDAEQLVIATLYFWSGLQKLNWSFSHEVIPGLLKDAGIFLPSVTYAYLWLVGLTVATFEALIGIGLLVRRTRKTAVVLAVSMHLTVLLMLIVSKRNSVVWIWNVGMIVMVVLLFWRLDGSLAWRKLWRWRDAGLVSHLPKVVIVICGLAPALSFVGWWDHYLSGAIYSGNTPVEVIRVSEGVRGRLPVEAQQQLFTTGKGELMLPLFEWSMADLNVPPYPEVRVYRQIARQVCALADNQQEIELIVKDRISIIDGTYSVTRTTCQDLSAR